MADYTEYKTVKGDRWDTIAHKAYGDSKAMDEIIRANPTVPMAAVLPEGTTILVPIKTRGGLQSSINTNNLPPWKR